MLIGTDLLPQVLMTGLVMQTVFGWAVLGPYPSQTQKQVVNVVTTLNPDPVNDILIRFWKVEEPPDNPSMYTPTEELVQQHYADTHNYHPEPGYYQVTLPRKSDHPPLGLSRPQALNRFFSNERSLIKKGNHESFQTVVREYLELGHAEEVPPSDLSSHKEHYYLPMHGVTKASSTSTKLRVVFDASAKTTNHLSLNETLHAGPTLHPTLEQILLQFRTRSVAISADISKMYRVVHLHPSDRNLHRFLWREDPSLPIV